MLTLIQSDSVIFLFKSDIKSTVKMVENNLIKM